jgi:hypothetical protein
VCQLLATGRWYSPDTPVPSTNKTDRHDITEIMFKVALNTLTKPGVCPPGYLKSIPTKLYLVEYVSLYHACMLVYENKDTKNVCIIKVWTWNLISNYYLAN